MDSINLLSLLEDLDDEIDDLEEALKPFLANTLSEAASKTPILDKAKLYVLVTYAIESMLFSYLRLNGVQARQHPVFKELTRVQQYFQKLKLAENPVGKRENMSVDVKAAGRIIKAGTTGIKHNTWQEEVETTRARAHIKFDELTEKMKQDEISKKRKVEEGVSKSESSSESGNSQDLAVVKQKKQKTTKEATDALSFSEDSGTPQPEGIKSKQTKAKKTSAKKQKMLQKKKAGK